MSGYILNGIHWIYLDLYQKDGVCNKYIKILTVFALKLFSCGKQKPDWFLYVVVVNIMHRSNFLTWKMKEAIKKGKNWPFKIQFVRITSKESLNS